jgi:hypothetical protein
VLPAGSGDQKIKQYDLVSHVTISDKQTIDFFIEEFFLPETACVSVDVIDTENNGFGVNDLLKFHPSGMMYYMDMVTDSAQHLMNSWKIVENFEIVTELRDQSDYDSLKTAPYGILSSIVKGIERNYSDYPISISLTRDSTGMIFRIWGYNKDSLQFSPPPPPHPDSVPVYDLFSSFREDSIFLPDTTMYDIFFVYTSEVDTVFLGE